MEQTECVIDGVVYDFFSHSEDVLGVEDYNVKSVGWYIGKL